LGFLFEVNGLAGEIGPAQGPAADCADPMALMKYIGFVHPGPPDQGFAM
jgi:hypothetical protein